MKLFLSKLVISKIILVLVFTCSSLIISYATNISVSGIISANTTWSADTIKVTGDVTVNNGIVLTINSGKIIQFQGNYKLIVLGRLLAIGEITKNIIFTMKDTTGLYDVSVSNGGWHGIRFEPATSANDTSKLTYCRLEYGKSIGIGNDGLGGAIFYNNLARLKVQKSIIRNCYALKGGAVYGISLNGAAFFNSLFYNNNSIEGGATFLSTSSARFINCTFSNNSATKGGVMYCTDSDPQITNSVLWNNTATEGNQLYLADDLSDPAISYSNIEGGSNAFAGLGSSTNYTGAYLNNLNANPFFLDPVIKKKFQLIYNSPCINTGNPTVTGLETGSADLGGNARLTQSRIDMGAYEAQFPYFKSHIKDTSIVVNIGTLTLNLSTYFGLTATGDSLVYSIRAGIDTSNVSLKINKSNLILTPKADKTGIDTIIIKATSAYNFSITDTFLVTVKYATITSAQPINNYKFTLRDERFFRWNCEKPAYASSKRYIVKMVVVENGQTADEAMNNNSTWYGDTTGLLIQTYGVDILVPKSFPSYRKIAWQVTVLDVNWKAFGKSIIYTFYGPPYMEAFYAGNSIIYVDTTTVLNMSNLSGRGRITISAGKTVVVNYSNLKVSGGYLKSGTINQVYKDTIILSPEYVSNGKAKFCIDTLYITNGGPYLKGVVKWNNAILSAGNITSCHTAIDYTEQRLIGVIKIPNITSGFSALTNSTIKIDSTSDFVIRGSNGYIMRLKGKVTTLFDNNKTQKDTANFTFASVNNLEYVPLVPAASQKPFNLNEVVNASPVNAYLDLSDTKSPGVITDLTWKGLWISKFKLMFNATNKLHQVRLNAGDGILINTETYLKSRFLINNNGIDLSLDTTFTNPISSTYNAFSGGLSSIRVNRPFLPQTKDQIKGNVLIPYIEGSNPRDYILSFDEITCVDSLVQHMDDFSFTPITEKNILSFSVLDGSNKIATTIDQTSKTISFTLPVASDIKKVVCYFATSGNHITINTTNQVRGITENDFSKPLAFNVYAGDGTIQSYKVSESLHLAISSISPTNIKIYPNPVKDILYIENATNKSEVSIFTTQGKLVKKKMIVNSKNEIPVYDLSSGLYILILKTGGTEVQSKFIKQ